MWIDKCLFVLQVFPPGATYYQIFQLQVRGDVSLWKFIFDRYKKKLVFPILNLRKPLIRRFSFLEYVLAWDILDVSGPFERRVLNMATSDTRVYP